jgi:hypothetical protein
MLWRLRQPMPLQPGLGLPAGKLRPPVPKPQPMQQRMGAYHKKNTNKTNLFLHPYSNAATTMACASNARDSAAVAAAKEIAAAAVAPTAGAATREPAGPAGRVNAESSAVAMANAPMDGSVLFYLN